MKVTQNRLDLMTTETVNGTQEKDPLSINYLDFEQQREAKKHTMLYSEQRRPDIISQDEYQSPGFWWFILAINGVTDPYEVPTDIRLTIPSQLDYFDWFRGQLDEV